MSLLTMILLLFSTILFATAFLGQYPNMRFLLNTRVTLALLVPGLLMQAYLLNAWIISYNGENFSLLYMVSLTTWLLLCFSCIFSLFERARGMWLLILPLNVAAFAAASFLPGHLTVQLSKSPGILLHIITSMISYSLLGFACMQAVLLLIFDTLLRKHNILAIANYFPPLQTLENWLVRLLLIGFTLLSISLLTGLFYLEDMFAQHQVHKTILSIFAWMVFAVFLLLHQLYGLRGRTASIWTICGFLILMLSYFGSKLAKEIILR